MNKRIKNKWIKALRDGSRKQVTSALHIDGGFCCLGVLCDIYTQENDVPWEEVSDADGQSMKERFLFSTASLLPVEVMRWANLSSENPVFNSYATPDLELAVQSNYPKAEITASDLNDEYGFTFKDIANLIEEQL